MICQPGGLLQNQLPDPLSCSLRVTNLSREIPGPPALRWQRLQPVQQLCRSHRACGNRSSPSCRWKPGKAPEAVPANRLQQGGSDALCSQPGRCSAASRPPAAECGSPRPGGVLQLDCLSGNPCHQTTACAVVSGRAYGVGGKRGFRTVSDTASQSGADAAGKWLNRLPLQSGAGPAGAAVRERHLTDGRRCGRSECRRNPVSQTLPGSRRPAPGS